MTELIGELTELARGEEQAAPLEDVRLDLVTEEAIRRTTRNHPEVPIERRARAVERWSGRRRASSARSRTCSTTRPSGAPPARPSRCKLAGGELTVRDHGPGIADDDVPHVFERFYRATSARSMPGSGLGLAIVQQVAEAHGGTISAERAPGGGTLMRFCVSSRNGRRATAPRWSSPALDEGVFSRWLVQALVGDWGELFLAGSQLG